MNHNDCLHPEAGLYRVITPKGRTHLLRRCPDCDQTLARPFVSKRNARSKKVPLWRDMRVALVNTASREQEV